MPADCEETAKLLGVAEKEVPWVQCLLDRKEAIGKKRKEADSAVASNNRRMELRPIFSQNARLAERQQTFFGDALRVFDARKEGHNIRDATVAEADLEVPDEFGLLYT